MLLRRKKNETKKKERKKERRKERKKERKKERRKEKERKKERKKQGKEERKKERKQLMPVNYIKVSIYPFQIVNRAKVCGSVVFGLFRFVCATTRKDRHDDKYMRRFFSTARW